MTIDQKIALISTLVGMLGVLLGVGLTSFVNWKLKSKEAHLRILEKIFDKRLQAHEEVLEISRLLRTTVSTKSADEGDNVITYPVIISSREEFDQFIRRFYELVNYNTHWLDIEVFRELNFIQDYIANVDILLKESNDDSFKEVALIIKSDIIDLAASLEEITMTFFDKDIYAIKIKTKKQHHKYKRTQTIKRLHSTELFKNWSEIEEKAEHNRADGRRS